MTNKWPASVQPRPYLRFFALSSSRPVYARHARSFLLLSLSLLLWPFLRPTNHVGHRRFGRWARNLSRRLGLAASRRYSVATLDTTVTFRAVCRSCGGLYANLRPRAARRSCNVRHGMVVTLAGAVRRMEGQCLCLREWAEGPPLRSASALAGRVCLSAYS